MVTVEFAGAAEPLRFLYSIPGDKLWGSTSRRLTNRVVSTIGWAPIDVLLGSPYLRGCSSYHMQIAMPEGLEPRGLRLAGPLRDDETGADVTPTVRLEEHSAHLYFRGASGDRLSFVSLRLRAGRRGFLSLSALTTLATAALLWAFQARVPNDTPTKAIAAAILLIFPALLAAFVVRPGEHALLSRVLTGVRLLVLVSGAMSVGAAAALAGIKPDAWTVHETWRWYAIGASAAWGALAISFILSLRASAAISAKLADWWENRRVYARVAFVVLLAGMGVLVAGTTWLGLPDTGPVAVALLAACGLAATVVTVQSWAVEDPPGAGLIPLIVFFAPLVSLVGLLEYVSTDILAGHWRQSWKTLAVAQAALIAAFGLTEIGRAVRARRAAES